MTLNQRTYQGQHDWPAIAELIQSDDQFYHPIDFAWRLCSTSLEDPRNAAVWEDEYGQRYTVDILITVEDKQAQVRSGWIIRADEDFPRLTTCFVL